MTSKTRWAVWVAKWQPEYCVLFRFKNKVIEVWALDRQNNLYKSDDVEGWEAVFDKNLPEFLEISEKEALKIILGGANYAKPIYSNYYKTYRVSGVP